jgi:hypothetical protein
LLNFKENPNRAGETANNILRVAGPMFRTIYGIAAHIAITKNFEYSGLGQLESLSFISNAIIKQFCE